MPIVAEQGESEEDRGQPPPAAAAVQFVGERADDPGTGRAQGVADGDGAAVAVDDLRV